MIEETRFRSNGSCGSWWDGILYPRANIALIFGIINTLRTTNIFFNDFTKVSRPVSKYSAFPVTDTPAIFVTKQSQCEDLGDAYSLASGSDLITAEGNNIPSPNSC